MQVVKTKRSQGSSCQKSDIDSKVSYDFSIHLWVNLIVFVIVKTGCAVEVRYGLPKKKMYLGIGKC